MTTTHGNQKKTKCAINNHRDTFYNHFAKFKGFNRFYNKSVTFSGQEIWTDGFIQTKVRALVM